MKCDMRAKRFRAGLLVVGACLSSWALPAHAGGAQTYAQRCAMCHGPDGAGVSGLLPRLKGRAAAIAANRAGRTYLVKAVLFGISGPITVDGKTINGMMPAMAALGDQEIADTLNFLVSVGNPKKATAPFTAAEIAKVRAMGPMTAAEVARVRAQAAAKGAVH